MIEWINTKEIMQITWKLPEVRWIAIGFPGNVHKQTKRRVPITALKNQKYIFNAGSGELQGLIVANKQKYSKFHYSEISKP